MRQMSLALIAALAASSAAAAPKPAAHKPAATARPPVVETAPAAPAATGPFDARDPSNVAALLASLGAKTSPAKREGTAVTLNVTSPVGGFTAQFDGCNPQGRSCAGVIFDASAEAKTATIAEINGFNQSSLACRIIQDKASKPHVLYSTLVFASTTRADMQVQVNAWRGCLADFSAFLKDPPGYLAAAP